MRAGNEGQVPVTVDEGVGARDLECILAVLQHVERQAGPTVLGHRLVGAQGAAREDAVTWVRVRVRVSVHGGLGIGIGVGLRVRVRVRVRVKVRVRVMNMVRVGVSLG